MYDLEGDSEGRIIAVGRIGSSTDFDMSAEAFILTPEGSANAFVVSYLGDVCGSIDLTVTELDFVLTAAEEDVDYQWIDCDQDDAIIPGATEQNYAPDVNGNFAVILTNELCVDTSDCIAVSGLGVIDNIPVNFSIVPNPSNGQFEIRLNGFNSSLANNLTIMDLSGKIIYNMTIPSGQKISSLIDLSNFESGIYIVTIESEENRITEKLELIK